MGSFTIFHNTKGSAYSGCDEILHTIKTPTLEKAVEWTKLWCGYDDVTRITGVGEEWHRESRAEVCVRGENENVQLAVPIVQEGPDLSWLVMFLFVYLPIGAVIFGAVWFALWMAGKALGGG